MEAAEKTSGGFKGRGEAKFRGELSWKVNFAGILKRHDRALRLETLDWRPAHQDAEAPEGWKERLELLGQVSNL